VAVDRANGGREPGGGYSYDWLDNGCASWGLHPQCVAAVSRRIALDRQGRVEVDGVVFESRWRLSGLAFHGRDATGETSMATVFDGVSCMGVRNMMRVEAKGVMDPADGMVAATRVELDD
jgi:hypothetical protein